MLLKKIKLDLNPVGTHLYDEGTKTRDVVLVLLLPLSKSLSTG